MKKLVLILIVALTAVVTMPAVAQQSYRGMSVEALVDSLRKAMGGKDTLQVTSAGKLPAGAKEKTDITVVSDKDTVSIKAEGDRGLIVTRVKRIDRALDDTLLNLQDGGRDIVDTDEADFDSQKDFVFEGMNTARLIVALLVFGLVAIVGLSLLFFYIHRRRRYKVIERAIAANYQLPPEFFGGKAYRQRAEAAASPRATPRQAPQAASIVDLRDTDLRTMRSGFTLIAVGLGLVLFFAIAGAAAMAGLMSAIVFLGLGKVAIAYQQQRQGYDEPTQEPAAAPTTTDATAATPPPAPAAPAAEPNEMPPVFNHDELK